MGCGLLAGEENELWSVTEQWKFNVLKDFRDFGRKSMSAGTLIETGYILSANIELF